MELAKSEDAGDQLKDSEKRKKKTVSGNDKFEVLVFRRRTRSVCA